MAKIDVDAEINSVRNKVQTVKPATTGAGYSHTFVKADGLYLVDQNGIETGPFGQGGLDVGCRVFSNVDVASGADTPFNDEIYDTDNMHSTTVNNERVTIQTAGKYLCVGSIIWESSQAGSSWRILRLKLNGTDLLTYDTTNQDVTSLCGQTTSVIMDLDVGDFITLNTTEGSGAALDLKTNGQISPYLMLQLIEPVAASGGLDIGARVFNNAAQTITNNVLTALSFNTERYDTDTIHDLSVNPTRLTCKTAGTYTITGNVQWEVPGSPVGGRELNMRFNGSTYIATSSIPLVGNYPTYMSINTIYQMEVDDYVELLVQHNEGVDLDIQAAAQFSPEFMMQRIG